MPWSKPTPIDFPRGAALKAAKPQFIPKWFRKIRRLPGEPRAVLSQSEQVSIFRCPKAKFELFEQLRAPIWDVGTLRDAENKTFRDAR